MKIKMLESWLRDALIANNVPASMYMQKLRSCLKEMKQLQAEDEKLRKENEELKEWRRRWDSGAAERKWKALGGSW